MRCGLVRAEDLAPESEQQVRCVGGFEAHGIQPTTCPGYTVRLPIVQEVATYYGWEIRGVAERNSKARKLKVTDGALNLVDVFHGEMKAAESWEMEKRFEESKKGSK